MYAEDALNALLQDCHGMSSCYQVCKMTCARREPVVNGDICKMYGSNNGNSVAQEACQITQVRIKLLQQ
jgi:hypothetical protein